MASLQSRPLRLPVFAPYSLTNRRTRLTVCPELPLTNTRISLSVPLRSSPKPSVPSAEQGILDAIAESDGRDVSYLPAVRTYENDLARLTLVGAVDFQQALTAAAADGGEAADEHIDSGMPAMVAETVFPGPSDDHSTISTRLFLPAGKVKEKAKMLRSSLTNDILTRTTSANILAMTFRQVILQKLWSFELVFFRPGTKRIMKDLENPREVVASFILSSPDEGAISMLAEVVSISAFESAERYFLDSSIGRSLNNLFTFFHKPRIVSQDSSVILYKLLEDELMGNAKILLQKFDLMKADYVPKATKLKFNWWASSVQPRLEKIGGLEFSAWVNEFAPAYKLQIDNDKLSNSKLEGWKQYDDKRWEVLLTHSQLVCLANVLDMYYEDVFTLPNKLLPCGIIAKSTNVSNNKSRSSLLKVVSAILVSGTFVVIISTLSRLHFSHRQNCWKYPLQYNSIRTSNVETTPNLFMEFPKSEDFCMSIVTKVKDAFGWPGEIMKEKSGSAWTGELPEYLRREVLSDSSSAGGSTPLGRSDGEIMTSAQDTASYQVVLSAKGEIVGFQPTSRVAVNHWAANPLAKELYGGRHLSPGLIEPGLKFSHPTKVAVVELLMSENPSSYFALARPANLS